MLALKYVLGGWVCCVFVACGGSVGSDAVDGGSGGSMTTAGAGGSMATAGAGGSSGPAGSAGDGGSGECSYRGRVYPVGATFRAGDGCNTCGCSASPDGFVVGCTKKACQCDPAAEAHQRQYVGKSPAECML